MSEMDIAAVVEAVCGLRAASALAAVQGPLTTASSAGSGGGSQQQPLAGEGGGGGSASGQAGEAVEVEGAWEAEFEEDGEFGQVSCAARRGAVRMGMACACGTASPSMVGKWQQGMGRIGVRLALVLASVCVLLQE